MYIRIILLQMFIGKQANFEGKSVYLIWPRNNPEFSRLVTWCAFSLHHQKLSGSSSQTKYSNYILFSFQLYPRCIYRYPFGPAHNAIAYNERKMSTVADGAKVNSNSLQDTCTYIIANTETEICTFVYILCCIVEESLFLNKINMK